MTTLKQVQKHIDDLVAQDKRDEKQLNIYYQQALTVIKNSLSAFFSKYADETGLSTTVVAQQASEWDLQQFESVINMLISNLSANDDLNKRLIAARATAQIDKAHVLSSIVTAGLAIATAKSQQYGNKALKQAFSDEYKYRTGLYPQSNQFPKENVEDFNTRVWVHNDISVINANHTLNKVIRKGLDQQALNTLLADNHMKPKTNNLDSATQTGISFNKRNLKINSIYSTNKATHDALQDSSIDYVKWTTEEDDRVCDICEPMDGNVYELSDAPVPQDDTHFGCRCAINPCDKDGNLI